VLQHVVPGVIGEGGAVSVDADELWILLDALPVAVLVSTDRACTRIWGNAAARAHYQLSPGQNFSRTAPEDELPPFQIYSNGELVAAEDLPLQRAATSGEPVAQSECEIRFTDGRRIFIGVHSIPIRDSVGEVCGSIGAFLDLTPQHRELEMAKIVSREISRRLRNTFSIIQAISRRMLRPLLPADAYEAYEDRLAVLARRQDLLNAASGAAPRIDHVVDGALAGIFGHSRERMPLPVRRWRSDPNAPCRSA
jgi:PAS domain-containing protein